MHGNTTLHIAPTLHISSLHQPTIKIGYCIEEDGNNGHCRPPYVKQILSTNTLTFGQFKRHFSLRHDNNVQ